MSSPASDVEQRLVPSSESSSDAGDLGDVREPCRERKGLRGSLAFVASAALLATLVAVPSGWRLFGGASQSFLGLTESGPVLLASALGVSIWEDAPLTATTPAARRHAIAYVWSDPQVYYRKMNWTINEHSYVGPFANGRGSCALALSGLGSKSLFEKSLGPDESVDIVVITDSYEEDHVAYLKSVGFRVLITNMTELYTFEKYDSNKRYHKDHRASYFKLRASSMKAGLAGLTEYETILYLDVDAYFFESPPNSNVFHGLGDSAEFLTKKCCNDAPLAVGMFALRPRREAFESMLRLIDGGFSPSAGWGLKGLRIGANSWPEITCKEDPAADKPGVKAYCADRNTTRWDFLGSEADKGLLFTEYDTIRGAIVKVWDIHKVMPANNIWGLSKPWMPGACSMEKSRKHKNAVERIHQYWDLYRDYSRSAMTGNSEASPHNSFCLAELDKGLESNGDCELI